MVAKRSGVTEPFNRDKIVRGVRRACQGRPVTEDQLAILAQRVEDAIRSRGSGEVPSHEVGLAILGPLRELDEVAYLRFASVYRGFESLADFEDEIAALRCGAPERWRPEDEQRLAGCRHAAEPGRRPPVTSCRRSTQRRRSRAASSNSRSRAWRGPRSGPDGSPEGESMTETASGTASQDGTSAGSKGLTMRRIYTREGVHPYDEVTWERRDVVMTNWRDGSVNFEQKDVEFPDFWSVNAANIVTTKYFRGAVGTPQREWSLKQLVDRVVGDLYRGRARARLFRHRRGRRDLRARAQLRADPPGLQLQLPGLVQRRDLVAAAGLRLPALRRPVSTPAGVIPIGRLVEDIAVGTKVHDAHGTTRIVATKANGVKEVLRLHTTAGLSLDVTADHLVWRAADLDTGEFTVAGFLRAGDRLLHVNPDVGGSDRRLVEVTGSSGSVPWRSTTSRPRAASTCPAALRDVHNCFILAVDDTMDSILEWYSEEGLIFKGGSGAGVNLSRIRSSKELLSSGGTASGPVSFMRGADASAGTIKSGGATRRAAKMVVLDVDHPDIEEFIETKAREEEKIRVLRDAGFDMDLGGKDIASVQYQNANNSVRVSDEFMQRRRDGRLLRPGRPPDRRGRRAGRGQGPVRQDGQGGLGLRRSRHPVRQHDQRLAYLPGIRENYRK